MRPSSSLINVSRGSVVDEEALISAIREKRLAGAALDVFQVEPLPSGSPLWQFENVIISPHMAGLTVDLMSNGNRVFMENLRRYLAAEPLLNVFDPSRGY